MLIHETPEFIDALWLHSEVLDEAPDRPMPSYREGANLLHYMLAVRSIENEQVQLAGHEVFILHREYLMQLLAGYIRMAARGRQLGWPVPQDGITPEEAQAAYHVLVYASEETQDQFLRGEADFQKALIYAVLKDGGLYDHRGFWCELVMPWA